MRAPAADRRQPPMVTLVTPAWRQQPIHPHHGAAPTTARAPDADRRQPPTVTTVTPVTPAWGRRPLHPHHGAAPTTKKTTTTTAHSSASTTATAHSSASTTARAHCRASGRGHSQGLPAPRQRCLTQILLHRGMKPPSERQQFPSEMGVMVQTKAPRRKIEDSQVLLRLG